MYCRWRFSYQEGRVGISLTGLTPPHFCVPSQTRTWISNVICGSLFMFSEWMWEAIVRFVGIGGIVAHHCFNFLFITRCQYEEFENINRVIRISKSKKHRQHNDQKKRDKRTNTDLKKNRKLKIGQHELTPLKIDCLRFLLYLYQFVGVKKYVSFFYLCWFFSLQSVL